MRRRVWQQVSTFCVANSGSQHDFRLLFVVLKGKQKDAPAILEGYTSKWAFKQVAAIPEGHFGSRSPCARPERTKGCLTNIAGPQLELCQGKQKKLHTHFGLPYVSHAQLRLRLTPSSRSCYMTSTSLTQRKQGMAPSFGWLAANQLTMQSRVGKSICEICLSHWMCCL